MAPGRAPASPRRPIRRTAAIRVLLLLAVLCFVTGAYLGVLRLTMDVSRVDLGRSVETRDLVYLGIHAGMTVVAAAGGYLVGRVAGGLGFAFMALVVMVSLAMMAAAQAGSFALACDGHNDLIRHWSC